jgi:purine-binding chemotaxis protein CheW
MSAIRGNERFLICRSGGRMIALELPDVRETMRPLPIESLLGVPAFVLGLAIIRGSATPVIDAEQLFGRDASGQPAADRLARRFVTLATGTRTAALQVDGVSGVRSLSAAQLDATPSLLEQSTTSGLMAWSVLDTRLLMVLQTSRLIPPAVWESIDRSTPS